MQKASAGAHCPRQSAKTYPVYLHSVQGSFIHARYERSRMQCGAQDSGHDHFSDGQDPMSAGGLAQHTSDWNLCSSSHTPAAIEAAIHSGVSSHAPAAIASSTCGIQFF